MLLLVDFGFVSLEPSEKRKSPQGFWAYWSPEVALNNDHSPSRDIWALGIVGIEMLLGSSQPLESLYGDSMNSWDYIEYISSHPAPEVPGYTSFYLHDFLTRCLDTDPTTRATAKELLEVGKINLDCHTILILSQHQVFQCLEQNSDDE
jgi:serine/threonine protein kinase